jgi:hypothetical protein
VRSKVVEKLWAFTQFDILDKFMEHINLVLFQSDAEWSVAFDGLGIEVSTLCNEDVDNFKASFLLSS